MLFSLHCSKGSKLYQRNTDGVEAHYVRRANLTACVNPLPHMADKVRCHEIAPMALNSIKLSDEVMLQTSTMWKPGLHDEQLSRPCWLPAVFLLREGSGNARDI
jgi:hypothetical protein